MKIPLSPTRKTCFLIDDDPDDKRLFLIALNTFDSSIELVTASDGVEALEKINANELFLPDYIFLDMNMPRMSGKESLIKLRGIERLKNIPIILYSTTHYSTTHYFEELSSIGASGFATKPNSIEGIIEILVGIIK